jgi:hypothetical protein
MTERDSLAGVAQRRSELEEAMQLVEREAAAPSGSAGWLDDLSAAVRRLEAAVSHHIIHVESPGGLLEEIVERAPRLQRSVEGTRDHHAVLAHSITSLLALLTPPAKGEVVPMGQIRADVIEILSELARHRQDGADLIHEAYDVDIGGY